MSKANLHLNIAIDGPAGAGKSTAARALAERLGIRYLDTGAMYRAMALYAARAGVDAGDAEGMARIVDGADITVRYLDDGSQRVLLAGEDVTPLLRTPSLSMGASMVGIHPPVRKKLAALQRQVGREYDVVMDGRDITTNVLPDTPHKFYLTASPAERARRRHAELVQKGGTDQTIEQIEQEIIARDANDMGRAYMPLRQAEDACFIDTTDMAIEEVTEAMLRQIRKREEERGRSCCI